MTTRSLLFDCVCSGLLLIHAIAQARNVEPHRYILDPDGSTAVIRFPSDSTIWYKDLQNVQEYLITVRDLKPNTFIRLIATDFLLLRRSQLKIFDGSSNYFPSFTYTWDSARPVFQSTSSTLFLVFKPAPGRPSAGNADLWAVSLSTVTEPRLVWADTSMPAIGYCGDLSDSGSHGTMVTMGTTYGGQSLPYDCVWSLHGNGEMMTVCIQVPDDSWISENKLQVHSDVSSSGQNLNSLLKKSPGGSSRYEIDHKELYLRLSALLLPSEVVAFSFDTPTSRLQNIYAEDLLSSLTLPTYSELGAVCPFRTCSLGVRNFCQDYWGTCRRDYDSSCDDKVNSVACKTFHRTNSPLPVTQCYHRHLDERDGYSDCYTKSDEIYPTVTPKKDSTPSNNDEEILKRYKLRVMKIVFGILSVPILLMIVYCLCRHKLSSIWTTCKQQTRLHFQAAYDHCRDQFSGQPCRRSGRNGIPGRRTVSTRSAVRGEAAVDTEDVSDPASRLQNQSTGHGVVEPSAPQFEMTLIDDVADSALAETVLDDSDLTDNPPAYEYVTGDSRRNSGRSRTSGHGLSTHHTPVGTRRNSGTPSAPQEDIPPPSYEEVAGNPPQIAPPSYSSLA